MGLSSEGMVSMRNCDKILAVDLGKVRKAGGGGGAVTVYGTQTRGPQRAFLVMSEHLRTNGAFAPILRSERQVQLLALYFQHRAR
jgi:hypothetical protein